jgi:hypothetical protein
MTDRIDVLAWTGQQLNRLVPATPSKVQERRRLLAFANGTQAIEDEHPRAPKRFRPFEWARFYAAWKAACAAQGVRLEPLRAPALTIDVASGRLSPRTVSSIKRHIEPAT